MLQRSQQMFSPIADMHNSYVLCLLNQIRLLLTQAQLAERSYLLDTEIKQHCRDKTLILAFKIIICVIGSLIKNGRIISCVNWSSIVSKLLK